MPVDPTIKQEIRVGLQDLELRLLNRLQTELAKKCDTDDCTSPDQVFRMIRDELEKAETRTWTRRERAIAVVLFLLTVLPPLLNFLILTGKAPS